MLNKIVADKTEKLFQNEIRKLKNHLSVYKTIKKFEHCEEFYNAISDAINFPKLRLFSAIVDIINDLAEKDLKEEENRLIHLYLINVGTICLKLDSISQQVLDLEYSLPIAEAMLKHDWERMKTIIHDIKKQFKV